MVLLHMRKMFSEFDPRTHTSSQDQQDESSMMQFAHKGDPVAMGEINASKICANGSPSDELSMKGDSGKTDNWLTKR